MCKMEELVYVLQKSNIAPVMGQFYELYVKCCGSKT
jgi:hypothetical protein